jgi:monovalent cation/hydrogen antiporter
LFLLAVPLFAVAVSTLARRLGLNGPLCLVGVGIVVSVAPWIHDYSLDPEFVLLILLPPLLYQAAVETSVPSLKDNKLPIALLSVLMVLVTTLLVGFILSRVVPGMPLSVGFVLGAVVGPPDTVAAISIARKLGLPRRIVDVLVGEGLFNDATALTAFRIALAAAMGESVTALDAVGRFIGSALGGLLVGGVAAVVWDPIRFRMRDPRAESAISLMLPFVVYITAEALHVSGVMGVVILGLYLGHRRVRAGFATRMQDAAVWDVIVEILESTVFALIGLQLIPILRDVRMYSVSQLLGYGFLAFGVVVAARFGGVFTLGWLRDLANHVNPRSDAERLSMKAMLVTSWAGMRGVVSLAAAFSIPLITNDHAPFPDRELVLFLTLFVVLSTLIIQGLTLPPLIQLLGVDTGEEEKEDALAYCDAMGAAAAAGLGRLDELEADLPDPAVDRMREQVRFRRELARVHARRVAEGRPSSTLERVDEARRSMLAAERAAVEHLRDAGQINDGVYRKVLYQLDLEEAVVGSRP